MKKPNALAYALGRYLAVRPRSEAEVRRYLQRKAVLYELDEDDIAQEIAKLQDYGVINDSAFVEALTHSMISKGKGQQVISQKLRQAGIEPKDYAQSASVDPADLTLAMEKRLAKRASTLKRYEGRQRLQKAYQILFSSGFSGSEIRPFLDDWSKKQ